MGVSLFWQPAIDGCYLILCFKVVWQNKTSSSSRDRCIAVQNERDQIRVRRPAFDESRTARPDSIAVATLHRAELLSREARLSNALVPNYGRPAAMLATVTKYLDPRYKVPLSHIAYRCSDSGIKGLKRNEAVTVTMSAPRSIIQVGPKK